MDYGPNIIPSSFCFRKTLTGHRDIEAISPVARIELIAAFSMPLLPKHDVDILAIVQAMVVVSCDKPWAVFPTAIRYELDPFQV
jgi:hypothetical protein